MGPGAKNSIENIRNDFFLVIVVMGLKNCNYIIGFEHRVVAVELSIVWMLAFHSNKRLMN